MVLYDQLSTPTLTSLESILLHSLLHEPTQAVRRKTVDSICDLANNSMARGRPWHMLQQEAFNMTQKPDAGAREAAYRVFSGCPNLVMDLQPGVVLRIFQQGLHDQESVEVRLFMLNVL